MCVSKHINNNIETKPAVVASIILRNFYYFIFIDFKSVLWTCSTLETQIVNYIFLLFAECRHKGLCSFYFYWPRMQRGHKQMQKKTRMEWRAEKKSLETTSIGSNWTLTSGTKLSFCSWMKEAIYMPLSIWTDQYSNAIRIKQTIDWLH